MINEETHYDAFNLLCGKLIGSGMTRKVFNCNVNADYVVKVEDADVRSHFQNLMEWFVWRSVCGTKWEKWFAPVIEISPNGRVLLMQKTVPLQPEDAPPRMPGFFTDMKYGNYGLYKGNVVCHDYGTHLLMEQGMHNGMKKANWYAGN